MNARFLCPWRPFPLTFLSLLLLSSPSPASLGSSSAKDSFLPNLDHCHVTWLVSRFPFPARLLHVFLLHLQLCQRQEVPHFLDSGLPDDFCRANSTDSTIVIIFISCLQAQLATTVVCLSLHEKNQDGPKDRQTDKHQLILAKRRGGCDLTHLLLFLLRCVWECREQKRKSLVAWLQNWLKSSVFTKLLLLCFHDFFWWLLLRWLALLCWQKSSSFRLSVHCKHVALVQTRSGWLHHIKSVNNVFFSSQVKASLSAI